MMYGNFLFTYWITLMVPPFLANHSCWNLLVIKSYKDITARVEHQSLGEERHDSIHQTLNIYILLITLSL